MTSEHTSFEKYTSHTLFSNGLRKGWCWLCVRGRLETEQTATYWPQVPLTIAALFPHSAGLLNRGPEGPSPLSGAGSHPGIWNSNSNSNCNCNSDIFDRMHLLFTPVHLLIDGSVEGQYVTWRSVPKNSVQYYDISIIE